MACFSGGGKKIRYFPETGEYISKESLQKSKRYVRITVKVLRSDKMDVIRTLQMIKMAEKGNTYVNIIIYYMHVWCFWKIIIIWI